MSSMTLNVNDTNISIAYCTWYHICLNGGMKNINSYCKKTLFVSAILLSGFLIADAQTSKSPLTPMRKGSVLLNAGVGIGAEYNDHYYNRDFGTKLAVEWGLWQAGPGVITLGPEIGASFSNGGYHKDYHVRTTIAGIRSAWHYGWRVKGLDTYGGFSTGIGFHHYQYRDDHDYDENKVLPVFGAFAGASYFVTPTFGFNAEAGYDITNFQVGIVFKLR